ncbi:MAG: hypothetical protein U0L20_07395 [Ruminococcus sp.]|nr:hypothetical protein [Ruminococcus sp.]
MTEYLADESGEFRKGDDGVFSGEKCIFMAPSARLVSELMEQLFSFKNENRREVYSLITSVVSYCEFVFIHLILSSKTVSESLV